MKEPQDKDPGERWIKPITGKEKSNAGKDVHEAYCISKKNHSFYKEIEAKKEGGCGANVKFKQKEKDACQEVCNPQQTNNHGGKHIRIYLNLMMREKRMFAIKGFVPRLYQKNIFETTKVRNTLVCLPTGTGKTKNAILLAVHRLNAFPEKKVLVISPTKPLSRQICEEFKDSSTIPPACINMLSGLLKPGERKRIWGVSKVVTATPQTIANDIKNNAISLSDVSLLVVDECHRSKERYANTRVASHYTERAKNPRILALTASPGATKEKIGQICKNLHIEDVEIRTEHDEDMSPYIQKKEMDYVRVDLPDDLKEAAAIVKEEYKKVVAGLKRFGLYKPAYMVNKRDLLAFQAYLRGEIEKKNRAAFSGISLTAQAIKLAYLLELIETQTTTSAYSFLWRLEQESTKAAGSITKNKEIGKVRRILEEWEKNKRVHPKLEKMREIVIQHLKEDNDARIIIFANYRDTVDEIVKMLGEAGVSVVRLVGKKDGVTQKMQGESIKKFEEGVYKVLVATSVGEEGLSINNATHCILYEAVPSEIRAIQRAGRVGRTREGKISMLITRNSRDQAYMWGSKKKEWLMRKTLLGMKDKKQKEFQSTLKTKEESLQR